MQSVVDARPRITIITDAFPPDDAGQARVLERLLSGFEPAQITVLKTSKRTKRLPTVQTATSPPAQEPAIRITYSLGLSLFREFRRRTGRSLGFWFHSLVKVASAKTAKYVRESGADVIIACTGGLFDVPVAVRVSRQLSVPLILYVFDDFLHQQRVGPYDSLVEREERHAVAAAAEIIVPNEKLARTLALRHGKEPLVIYNPVESADLKEPLPAAWPREPGRIRIVFTGQIYGANLDAIRNLLSAIAGEDCYEFHIYSHQGLASLTKAGIRVGYTFHGFLPAERVREVQRSADILFLPLAFNFGSGELVDTASPTKFGEYLASGRPVLIHAPPTSFVAEYAEAHACAAVVPTPTPVALRQMLDRIQSDVAWRLGLVQRARNRCLKDFDPAVARQRLSSAIERAQAQARRVD